MAQFEEVGVKAVVQGYDKFIFEIGSMDKNIRGLAGAGSIAAAGLQTAGVALGVFAALVGGAVAIVGGFTKALYEIGKTGVETATSFESAFAGILKTTNDLGTNIFDLTESGKAVFQEFRDLAKEIPLSFEELAKIGEFAGQLGIPEEALASFTRTVAALGVSTELSTEQAALGLARIANVYGVSADDMASNTERMGSTLAYLGNNFAAMEDEILIFARNIAGTTSALGITQDQLFAIGTAFTAAGNTAEAGGSSVQRILLEMSKAVQSGGKDLSKWAEATGLTAQEFADQWGSEGGPARTFLTFMQNLAAQGEGASQVLADLDVDTIRVLRTMLSAAGSVDILEQALAGANTAWEQNTALTREADIRYNTFESQIEIIKNKFRDMAATIGFELIPTFEPLFTEVLDPFMEGLEAGLPGAIDTVVGAIQNDFIPSLIDLADRLGLTDPQSVADGVQNLANIISENIGKFSDFMDSITEEDIATVAEDFGNLVTNVSEFLSTLGESEGAFKFLTGLIDAASKLYAIVELVILSFRALGELFDKGAFSVDTFEAWMDARQRAFNIEPVEIQPQDLITSDELQAQQTAAAEKAAEASLNAYGATLYAGYAEQAGVAYEAGATQAEQLSAGFEETLTTETQQWAMSTENLTNPILQTFQEVQPAITEELSTGIGTSLEETSALLQEPISEFGTTFSTNMIAEIEVHMDEFKQEGFDVGVAIMEGMKLGILAKVEVIANTAATAVAYAIEAAKEAAGIESPSKEGYDIGYYIGEGINLGLFGMFDKIKNTMVSGMASVISAGQTIMPQTTNNTSTYDNSFNVGDISMVSSEQTPMDVGSNLSLLASLRS